MKDLWKGTYIPAKEAKFIYADRTKAAKNFRERATFAFGSMKLASDTCDFGPGLADPRWRRGFTLLKAGLQSVKTEDDIKALEKACKNLYAERQRRDDEERDRRMEGAYND